jgi:hypothetical protein
MMARSQSEILTRPSSVPKKREFGLALLSELPESSRSDLLKSGMGSSADISEEDADGQGAEDCYGADSLPTPLGERRWSNYGTWSEEMYHAHQMDAVEDADDADDMMARDWDPHGCHDDMEEDRVEDVARDSRRCHSLSDLQYLEEVVGDVEDRFLEVKEMVDIDVDSLLQDAAAERAALPPAAPPACADALHDVVLVAQAFLALSPPSSSAAARRRCMLD